MEMEKFNKILDEDLYSVMGGAQRKVWNEAVNESNVRTGPGLNYETGYSVQNGDYVNTTGRHRYNDSDGYIWYELTDGNWIAGSLIGY
jgi:uncharacterized protein YgiM (DUF1202 family)